MTHLKTMQEQIIEFLKESQGYISGEEISKSLNISRAGIWKYIQDIKEQGYDVVAVPHLGYKLVSVPDKLFVHEIQFGLGTQILGKKIIYYETVDSTMDVAFRLGSEGAAEGTVVIAEGQTKGRGRRGRTWLSPKGKGIYFSIILRPELMPNEIARLTLLSAVAVAQAIKKLAAVNVAIKWPNDLLIDDKKVAGILTELSAEADLVKFVVVGIGVNVNSLSGHLPDGATSLRKEAKGPISRLELTKEILREMEGRYLELQTKGFLPIAKAWKDLSMTLNKRVKVVDPSETVEGTAIDIDGDGGLLLRKDSGVIIKKMAGDVVQIR